MKNDAHKMNEGRKYQKTAEKLARKKRMHANRTHEF